LGNPRVSTERYLKGEKVRISNGPLCGLQGTMVDQGKKYLLIRIDAISKSPLVNIPAGNVRKWIANI